MVVKIEYKRSIHQRLSLCKQRWFVVHHFVPNFVSQFNYNVSQHKIVKNLGISPSTVHIIVKRFRESGEISVRKVQGWKPLLNACDHRALRRYCLRNHHATMMDIATWAQEYFGMQLEIVEIVLCKEEGIY